MNLCELLEMVRWAVADGQMPPHLGEAVAAFSLEHARAAERFRARDALLLEASDLLQGTRWAKATRLRLALAGAEDPDPRVAALVAAARLAAPVHATGRTPGQRRLLAILRPMKPVKQTRRVDH